MNFAFFRDAEGNGLAEAEFGLYEAGSPSPHEDASVEAIHTFRTNISGVAIVSLEKAVPHPQLCRYPHHKSGIGHWPKAYPLHPPYVW